jgi:hypothetical protein
MKLGQGPKRRINSIRIPDELADAGGFRFIEVELRYIGRVEIQGYRPRSSSMIFVLSLTRGIRSQTFRMDAKIRAFLAAAMRRGEVIGRNSATGSPRLSITITPPSAASRTNFDVLMCSSRIDVVLICYIVAPDLPRQTRGRRLLEPGQVLRRSSPPQSSRSCCPRYWALSEATWTLPLIAGGHQGRPESRLSLARRSAVI